MSKVLFKWEGNYADEFDLSGWVVWSKEEAEKYLEFLINYDKEINWYFGTNEYMEYECGADLANEFNMIDITDDESKVLEKFFENGFGETSAFYQYCDDEEDEESEEDKDL